MRVFSVFSDFFWVFSFFWVFFGLFRNSLFRLFRFYTKTESFYVSMNQNKQKTQPNSLKESIFENYSENLRLFQFITKQICLFRLFRYRFETPKQTEIFSFWFHETNRNKCETDLIVQQLLFRLKSGVSHSVYSVSVSREP